MVEHHAIPPPQAVMPWFFVALMLLALATHGLIGAFA